MMVNVILSRTYFGPAAARVRESLGHPAAAALEEQSDAEAHLYV